MDSPNLAALTAQPVPLTVRGRTYHVHPLTLNDLGQLQAWIDAQHPDPLAVAQANLSRFNVAQQKHLLAIALELAAKPKPRLGTPEADAFLLSIDGIREVLFLTIAKGDPKFTRDEAAVLLQDITEQELQRALEASGAVGVVGDPKASTPTPDGAGTT